MTSVKRRRTSGKRSSRRRRRKGSGKQLTREKACKILHDGMIRGRPLTDKQRRFFGAICSGYIKTSKRTSRRRRSYRKRRSSRRRSYRKRRSSRRRSYRKRRTSRSKRRYYKRRS